jgi:hypothetical protein
MTRFVTMRVVVSMGFVAMLAAAAAPPAAAADSPVGGTYVMKARDGKPEMTMKIDQWGPGKVKLSYHLTGLANMEMTVVSDLKGKDAIVAVNGKPTGETMAITISDLRHSTAVVKMNGKVTGKSKATFTADFKTLTVETDMSETDGQRPAGKATEVWTRQ